MEGKRLPYLIVVLLVSGVGFFPISGLAQFINHHQDSLRAARNIDERLLLELNHLGSDAPTFDDAMLLTSQSLLPVAIIIPSGLIISGLSSRDKTETSAGVTIGASTAVAITLQELVLKPIFARDRPFHTLDGVRMLDSSAHGFSFPSSHATISWELAVGLSLRYPKWYVIAPSVLYALTVSFSRPCLGVHYPTDVLAGAILGSAIQCLGYVVQKSLTKNTPYYYSSNSVKFQPASISIVLPLQ